MSPRLPRKIAPTPGKGLSSGPSGLSGLSGPFDEDDEEAPVEKEQKTVCIITEFLEQVRRIISISLSVFLSTFLPLSLHPPPARISSRFCALLTPLFSQL